MSDRVISHALMSLFQVSISISLTLWRAYDKKTNLIVTPADSAHSGKTELQVCKLGGLQSVFDR